MRISTNVQVYLIHIYTFSIKRMTLQFRFQHIFIAATKHALLYTEIHICLVCCLKKLK